MFSYVDPNLNWEDLKWIRAESKGATLVVKGSGSVEVSLGFRSRFSSFATTTTDQLRLRSIVYRML